MTCRPSTRVVVAMSGGVDSSVAAALLKEQGYDVVGVTMHLWPDPANRCCGVAAIDDARRVAGLLGIPYYVLNFKEVFAERVIADFCREYQACRTPNPCLVCNRDIKFRELLRRARELDAAYVATGHYARIQRDPSTGRYLLLKGVDAGKDQSYALYMLDQEQLSAALFPVGGMRKSEVRRTAARLGLSVARKPDSQEICFITGGDYRNFLRTRCPEIARPGPIVDGSGKVLGEHEGLAFYTVGQRKGIGLAGGIPMYVLELDRERNALVVGTAGEAFRSDLTVSTCNFIPFDDLRGPMAVGCKIRYRAKEAAATIEPLDGGDGRARVTFAAPQRAITPGQAAVFYDGEVVVGGGTID